MQAPKSKKQRNHSKQVSTSAGSIIPSNSAAQGVGMSNAHTASHSVFYQPGLSQAHLLQHLIG